MLCNSSHQRHQLGLAQSSLVLQLGGLVTVKGRVPELNEEGQEPWRKVHDLGIPERGLAFLSVQWKSGFFVLLKENASELRSVRFFGESTTLFLENKSPRRRRSWVLRRYIMKLAEVFQLLAWIRPENSSLKCLLVRFDLFFCERFLESSFSLTRMSSSGKSQRQQEADLEQQLKTLLPNSNQVSLIKPKKNDVEINQFFPLQMEDVMEEAAAYIEKLQNNLIGQIRTHGYPDKLRSYGSSGAKDDRETIQQNVDKYVCSTMSK